MAQAVPNMCLIPNLIIGPSSLILCALTVTVLGLRQRRVFLALEDSLIGGGSD